MFQKNCGSQCILLFSCIWLFLDLVSDVVITVIYKTTCDQCDSYSQQTFQLCKLLFSYFLCLKINCNIFRYNLSYRNTLRILLCISICHNSTYGICLYSQHFVRISLHFFTITFTNIFCVFSWYPEERKNIRQWIFFVTLPFSLPFVRFYLGIQRSVDLIVEKSTIFNYVYQPLSSLMIK